MTFQEHKIFNIDEYILDKNKGNEFLSLVESFFREKKLTFALLEVVILKEQGIGDTFIFAKKEFESASFYKRYVEIINRFKEEFNGGVSSFKEWYEQDSCWIYTGEGSKDDGFYSIGNYGWFNKYEARDLKVYGIQQGLDKNFVETYFNKYAEEISNLELNNHPNYFIVIHPFGKQDKEDFLPYGNLYLHFATIEKVDLESIKYFMLRFMLIWYKYYGGLGHKSVLKKLVSTVLLDSEVNYFLPPHLLKYQETVEFLFAQYFVKEGNLNKFQKRVDELKVVLTELMPQKPDGDFSVLKGYKAQEFNKWSKEFTEKNFENFLLSRALFVYLFVVRDFSILEVKNIMKKNYSTSSNNKNDLFYFYHNYLFYFPETMNTNACKTELKKGEAYSPFEKWIVANFSTAEV